MDYAKTVTASRTWLIDVLRLYCIDLKQIKLLLAVMEGGIQPQLLTLMRYFTNIETDFPKYLGILFWKELMYKLGRGVIGVKAQYHRQVHSLHAYF